MKTDSIIHSPFLRFCVVGGGAAAVHYGIYYLLLLAHLPVNAAYIAGYLISFVGNFFATSYFTFQSTPSWSRLVGFAGSHSINFVLHILLLNLFLWMGVHVLLAPLLVMGVAMLIQYTILHTLYQDGLNGFRNYALASPLAFCWNLLLVYVAYMLCRVAFVAENWNQFHATLFQNAGSDLLRGSLLFDTSGILYTNALYALLMLFPLHWKEQVRWQKVYKSVWLFINAICLALNIGDSVYFQYTGRRSTATLFSEFSAEGNLTKVLGVELLNHWYLVVFFLGLLALLWRLYLPAHRACHPRFQALDTPLKLAKYYIAQCVALALFVPLAICGMRGGATTAVRPITVSNANQYVNRPAEAAVILNTPFSLIRTYHKAVFKNPQFFSDEELAGLYSPLHVPTDSVDFQPKNIVVLIVESMGREYIGAYNEQLEDGHYKGYTPFLDSLYTHCVSFDYTFSNGRKSIDGMPSILSSIPMFVEPFFLTPASLNEVSGLAGELGKMGYSSAFFHGAENGSMGFQAFARATGFQQYKGRTEYNADNRFGGDADYDGTWAIWDEPFLQFYALQMSALKEPFITTVFTASSHHPFAIPDAYREEYPEDPKGNPILKCIRYTDHALAQFFATAQRQPWFQNTLFVLTSDHTNMTSHAEYETDLGVFGSPILFYDPSGTLAPGRRPGIAQQIDIMPTLLNYLGYPHPYIAFGQDVLHTPPSQTWAVNYQNGIYQFVQDGYLLQFDGSQSKALYDIQTDWMLRQNQLTAEPERTAKMERQLKALIQSYMERMINDDLTVKHGKE